MRTNSAKGLLRRFMSEDRLNCKINGGEEKEEEDVELSLGLSLNGKFGVDPKARNLTRSSSSISDFTYPERGNDGYYMVPVIRSVNIVRTCSLPTETEKEWKKRKELQMLRRLEAKRKRTEKLKILKERNKVFAEESCGEGNGENGTIPNDPNYRQEQFFKNFNGLFRAGSKGVSPSSSPGSGSSASESESQQLQEMNKVSEIRSPENGQLLSECEQTVGPKSTFNGNSGCQASIAVVINTGNAPTVMNGPNETKNMFKEMPSVFTKGDGPNGKRIEGFLYRYRKGEEVRIVCVCHGSFFSPAEFVKHAGGSEVDHPLKHIVVSSQPLV